MKYLFLFFVQVPQYRLLYDMAVEAQDTKKKTVTNKGRLDMLPKTPVSKFIKAAKFGTTFGALVKSVPAAPAVPQSQERSGSIAAALKKTTNVPLEIGASTRLLGNMVEAMKKSEGTGTDASDVIR